MRAALFVVYASILIIIEIKYVTVHYYKGPDQGYFLTSFFRLYSRNHRHSTSSDKRRLYMHWNNALNRALYCLLLLAVVLTVI